MKGYKIANIKNELVAKPALIGARLWRLHHTSSLVVVVLTGLARGYGAGASKTRVLFDPLQVGGLWGLRALGVGRLLVVSGLVTNSILFC